MDKSKEKNQSLFDFVIERLGFAFFCGIAGLIYAGVICITLLLLKIDFPAKPLLHSFGVIFGFTGAILGQKAIPIIMSTIYGLMYLWGVMLSFASYESSYLLNKRHFPKKSEYLFFVLLGFFAVAIFLFIK